MATNAFKCCVELPHLGGNTSGHVATASDILTVCLLDHVAGLLSEDSDRYFDGQVNGDKYILGLQDHVASATSMELATTTQSTC